MLHCLTSKTEVVRRDSDIWSSSQNVSNGVGVQMPSLQYWATTIYPNRFCQLLIVRVRLTPTTAVCLVRVLRPSGSWETMQLLYVLYKIMTKFNFSMGYLPNIPQSDNVCQSGCRTVNHLFETFPTQIFIPSTQRMTHAKIISLRLLLIQLSYSSFPSFSTLLSCNLCSSSQNCKPYVKPPSSQTKVITSSFYTCNQWRTANIG